jgi:5,10-methylenetetrahydromethanopterin reductase
MDIGINFNGDMSAPDLEKAARAAEEAGFTHIWVGESINYVHPFPIMTACLEYTERVKVGTGIISPQRTRRYHIRKACATMKEVYGDRVLVGLAPGDRYGLQTDCIDTGKVLALLEKSVQRFRETDPTVPVFIGASGPRLIEMGSRVGDGVLLNYVHPDYVKWAIGHFEKDTYKAVYGPSLVLPDDELVGHLRGAAAVVAAGANHVFVRENGLVDLVHDIRRIVKEKRWRDLAVYEEPLLENFAIAGSGDEIKKRIQEYEKMGIDQVIFGTPLGRSLEAIEAIGDLI